MGFKINLGQIASGAMQQYLKDDDARIAADGKARERFADEKFEREKLKIAHDYRLKEDKEKDDRQAISDSAVDPHFAYDALSPSFYKKAQELNMSVLDPTKESAQRFGTGDTSLRRIDWLERNIGILLKDDNKLLKTNQDLAKHMLEQANSYIGSGEISGKRTNAKGEPIDGEYLSSAFKNIQTLADLSGQFKFGTVGENYYNLFDKLVKSAYMPATREGAKIVKDLTRSSSLNISTTEAYKPGSWYVPRRVLDNSLHTIEASGSSGLITNTNMAIGQLPQGSTGYELAKEAFISKALDKSSGSSPSIYTGFTSQNKPADSQRLDLIGSFVLFSSPHRKPIPEIKGRIYYPYKLPDNRIKAAEKMNVVFPDAKKLLETSGRLVQLNDEMQALIAKNPNMKSLNVGFVRELWTKIAPVAKVYGFGDKATQAVLEKGSFKDYTDTITSDIKSDAIDINGNNLRTSMSAAFERIDARINFMKNQKDDKSGAAISDEIIKRQIQYEYLKIQTIFHIAKLIQGGTGGRGVSNMDFENVAKSLSQGPTSTLANENTAFNTLYANAVSSYAAHFVGRQAHIDPLSSDVLEDKIVDIYWDMRKGSQRQGKDAEAAFVAAQRGDPRTTTATTSGKEPISSGGLNKHILELMELNPTWSLEEATEVAKNAYKGGE